MISPPTSRKIAVIGLGYVGLPVAVAFAASGADVIGFDINEERIEELTSGHDRTREIDDAQLRASGCVFTSNPAALTSADFFIVTVPTPIDQTKRPDMTMLLAASRTVGAVLKKGDIVVYESTVYPGATEEDCVPVLATQSGLKSGQDFHVGYSPERINPGDKNHRFENIVKVVSGQDQQTLDIIAGVYSSVVKAGLHLAPTIKVAEAAKVIENTQRDLNIALMNELSLIFNRLEIDTGDVLAAAGSKWNFLKFTPGLVGGHCIGVDPYYLTHRAEKAGHAPQVILAGRRINDTMGSWIGRECVKRLMRNGGAKSAIVLGITFKENVPDIRNSRVVDIVHELKEFGLDVQVTDPLASSEECRNEYGFGLVSFSKLKPADAVILAVPHQAYKAGGWADVTKLLNRKDGLVVDVKSILDRATQPPDIKLWRV
jgi:UDP-N-acetyl-D-glucosamine/UDP-N-acetyl-D-galactosamine dehydrogenase